MVMEGTQRLYFAGPLQRESVKMLLVSILVAVDRHLSDSHPLNILQLI